MKKSILIALLILISLFFIISCGPILNLPIVQKISGPNGDVLLTNYSFSWSATSSESTIIGYQIKKDSGSWINTSEASYTWNDISRGSHTFSVKAKDSTNKYSNAMTWTFSNLPSFPEFITKENIDLIKITNDSTSLAGIDVGNYYYDNLSQRLLTNSVFYEYDGSNFILLDNFTMDWGYPILGYGNIIKIDNSTDIAKLYDYNGNFIKQFNVYDTPGTSGQSIYGFFIDENNFVLSTDEDYNIVQYNISTDENEILLAHDGIRSSAICQSGDYYYVYKSSGDIYRFDPTENSGLELVVSDVPNHVTGMVVINHRIYFVSNFGNGFYIYDMNTEEMIKYYYFYKPKGLFILEE